MRHGTESRPAFKTCRRRGRQNHCESVGLFTERGTPHGQRTGPRRATDASVQAPDSRRPTERGVIPVPTSMTRAVWMTSVTPATAKNGECSTALNSRPAKPLLSSSVFTMCRPQWSPGWVHAFLVNECPNFDVLEEKSKTAKIPS